MSFAAVIGTVRVGQEPHGLAADSRAGVVYVAHHWGGLVSILDGASLTVQRSISLGYAAGGNGAALDPLRGRLYVANKFTGDVSRVDTAGGTPPANLPVGAQPDGVAVDSATGRVYVANFGSNTISLLDGATGATIASVAAGGEPAFIALDPARGRFYVTNHLGSSIGVHDVVTGAWLKTIMTGGGPYGIALDPLRNRLFTADRDGYSVTIVDLTDDSIVKHMPLACQPYQVAVNPASGHLFVVCADEQRVHVYDQGDAPWLGWLPVGRGAGEGIAVDPVTGRVYVSNADDDTVTVLQDSGPRSTPTPLPTGAATFSPTPSRTPIASPTPSNTPSITPTPSATATASPTATATPSPTPTATKTLIPSTTPTATLTPLLPGKPDHFEPDNSPAQASTLTIGGPAQEHTFHQPGDVDWLRFSATAGRYMFQAVAVAGIEPAMTLYAPDGLTPLDTGALSAAAGPVGLADAAGLPGTTSYLTWSAPADGVYFLRVAERSARGGSGAFYSVSGVALTPRIFLPGLQGPAGGNLSSSTSALTGQQMEMYRNPLDCAGGPAGRNPPDCATRTIAAQATAVTGRAGRAAPAAGLPQPLTALAADPITGDLYGAGAGELVRWDPAAGVLARAALGGEPAGLALGRYVYVAVPDQGALLAFDPITLVPEAEARGLGRPGGLALAAGHVFVADTAGGAVYMLDDADLRPLARSEVGPGPYAVAALAATGRIFVALGGGDGVAVLDTTDGRLLGVTALDGLGHPQGLAADPVGGRVYALYLLAPRYRQIAVLDGASGALLRVIPATLDRPLAQAAALALDAADRRLLVSDAAGLLAYDLTQDAWAAPLRAAGPPAPIFGLAVDGQRRTVYSVSGPRGAVESLVLPAAEREREADR